MYCGECGAKNKNGDLFCSECGAKLEISKKDKEPFSKKTKIIIVSIVLILLVLGIFYKIGESLTSPKTIAKNYIEALINNDSDKLYNYMGITGDKTFVSKKLFKEISKNENDSKIENYVITDIKYADSKLNAVVTYSYTLKENGKEKTNKINLTKTKEKKLLLFDNWKIQDLSSSEMILENYQIQTQKNSKVIYGGIKVDSKYIDKKQSTEKLDVYILPKVFMSKTDIEIELENGFKIKDTITPSRYYKSYKVKFDEDLLTENEKKSIMDNTKSLINTIYNGIIENKDVKELNLDFENIEDIYEDELKDLKSSNITLTNFEITDMNISSASLDNDYNLKVRLYMKYKYSLKYLNSSKEEKMNEGSSSEYLTIIFGYEKGKFNIKNIDDIDLYFSRYF